MANNPLQIAKDALARALETEQRNKGLLASLGPAVIEVLAPVLNEILAVLRQGTAETKAAIEGVSVAAPVIPAITIPEIKIPEINVPAPQVTVNVTDIKVPPVEVVIPEIRVPEAHVTVEIPEIRIPDLRWPEGEMPINGWVQLMGVDLKHPLPVQIRDADGKPVHFGGGSSQIIGGGGGGPNMIRVINTADQPIPVTGTISATFSADFGQGATGAQTLRTVAATDSIQSVNIVSGSSSGTEYADGTARGTATGTLMMLDDGTNIQSARGGSGNADSRTLRVVHASDAIVSVNIVSGTTSGATGQGDAASAARVVIAGNSDASVVVNSGTLTAVTTITNTVPTMQVSGNVDSVYVNNPVDNGDSATALRVVIAGNSNSSVSITNSSIAVTKSGTWAIDNPVAQGDSATALRVVIAGNSDASVSATQVGTWNIGTVTTVTGVTNSVAASLVDSSGVQYSGSNPLPTTASLSVAQGQGDSATAMRIIQAGDSVSSVYVNNPVAQGDAATALRVVIAGNSDASVSATQVGTWNIATVTTVTGVTNSVAAALVDSSGVAYSGSNPLPTTGSATLSAAVGQGDGASALRVIQAGDSVSSVYVNNPVAQGDAATALRVVVAGNSDMSVTATQSGTWAMNQTQWNGNAVTVGTGYQDNALRVVNATDAVTSVYVNNPVAQGDAATALRVVIAGNSDSSVTIQNATLAVTKSGTWAIDNPVAQGDAATALRVVVAGNSDMSVAATQVGTWTVALSGALTSAVVVGDTLARVADAGAAPVKVGGIARTTQSTAYADGDRANFVTDKLGRQLTRPVQVRDLIATAYVSLTTGTEATLLAAGGAGVFLDCIMITATNSSTVATQLDIRDVTAGNIVHTMYLPASTGPIGWAPSVPYPQGNANNNWTIDMPDQTGTTVYVTGLFSKEI